MRQEKTLLTSLHTLVACLYNGFIVTRGEYSTLLEHSIWVVSVFVENFLSRLCHGRGRVLYVNGCNG